MTALRQSRENVLLVDNPACYRRRARNCKEHCDVGTFHLTRRLQVAREPNYNPVLQPVQNWIITWFSRHLEPACQMHDPWVAYNSQIVSSMDCVQHTSRYCRCHVSWRNLTTTKFYVITSTASSCRQHLKSMMSWTANIDTILMLMPTHNRLLCTCKYLCTGCNTG